MQRRARRILPNVLCGASFIRAFCWSPAIFLARYTGSKRSIAASDLNPGDLISHLLLVHNLSSAWFHQINAPLWSVATEWQIYFLLPLILLPLFRRAGIAVTLVCRHSFRTRAATGQAGLGR